MISIEGLLEDEQGLTIGDMLTVKFCQPSHEFTFGVGITFIPLKDRLGDQRGGK
jgi:hypothetical protein